MIEKKRRDKINNSLGELRRLVPAAFEKQGSSKLEKAEILQMTVDYLRLLHANGLADILISKNKNLEQLTPPSHPRPIPAPPGPPPPASAAMAAAAAAAAAASVTNSTNGNGQINTSTHSQHQQAAVSMAQAGYNCQQHALASRVSPANSSDQFGAGGQDVAAGQTAMQNVDTVASYHHHHQHPRALYQYHSTIYPGHQEHLPSYYYS